MTIAQMNDEFRSNPGKFSKNKVVMSLSVSALDPIDQESLIQQVSTFSDFNKDNDPFDEHDFGAIDFVTAENKRFIEIRNTRLLQNEANRNKRNREDADNTYYNDQEEAINESFEIQKIEPVKYFWKIDYYDANLEYGSDDPANDAVTTRVLTIMEASEY